MKKLLFITWDSDQTNYLENLFFPILAGLQGSGEFECHVLQFSWAGKEELERISSAAQKLGLVYLHRPVYRIPHPGIGAFFTVWKGAWQIRNYVQRHEIDILMPRSTMPAWMVNRISSWLKRKGVKVVFDADGLPLEERVDFTGLSTRSLQYRWLKSQETKLLRNADRVLTRSEKAIAIHLKTIGEEHRKKFNKVSNGRDVQLFQFDEGNRKRVRKKLGLAEQDMLFIYSGTLGPQYAWEEMAAVFQTYQQKHPHSRWLILSRSRKFLFDKIPPALKNLILVKQVPYSEIPQYLSAADVAFSLRQPTYSMQGIAPIKLGEYLLMGLPTLASKGIGDTESLLEGIPAGTLYDHHKTGRVDKAVSWIEGLGEVDRKFRPEVLVERFGLEETVRRYGEVIEKMFPL